VRAAERHGSNEQVLTALALGKYDPAAVVGRFQAASERYGILNIRSAHRSAHMYQSMPADIVWDRRTEGLVRQLALDADILHLNNSWRPWQRLRLGIRKPLLLHHHGSLFRQDPKGMLQQARNLRATQAVSTVDLMYAAPDLLHWLPTAYDIDGLVEFGRQHREPHEGIRVVSAPTNREWKSTPALEAAITKLQADGLDIELVLIEGRPWAECMAIKASADIYFDQVKLGYGCNAVEAWGMGIPVIAGAEPWTIRKMTQLWGSIPFYQATEETIGEAIAALATNKRLRTKWAKAGMTHVRTYHDELPALRRLAELYHLALSDTPQAGLPLPPTTFIAAVPQVHIANRYINFPFTTDNQFLANRIRLHGLRWQKYGIQEVLE
jgi:hypothetical protein